MPSLDLIRRIPISMFGVALGITGQVGMWLKLAQNPSMKRFDIPVEVSQVFWVLAAIVLLVVTCLYSVKTLLYPRSMRTEFHCYYQSNFFLMPFLCLIALITSIPPKWYSHPISPWPLAVAITPLLMLQIYLYGEWMYGVNRSLRLAQPAFQLSVVGNFLAAGLAAISDQHSVAVGLFAIGCLYLGLVLAAMHMQNNRVKRDSHGEVVRRALRRRLSMLDRDQLPVLHPTVGRIVHNPWSVKSEVWALPPGLQPTLFLCVAPPAVAASSWAAMNKDVCDRFCQALFSVSLFFLVTMVVHIQRFLFRTPFSVAVWAFTFPSAALASAGIEYADEAGNFMVYFALVLSIFAVMMFLGAASSSIVLAIRRGIGVLLSPGSEAKEPLEELEADRHADNQYFMFVEDNPDDAL